MTEERTTPGEKAAKAPAAFPVPRNRPVLPPLEGFEAVEHDAGEPGPTRHRRLLEMLLLLALTTIAVFLWLATRPATKTLPPPPVAEVRVPTDDPAVEIYFSPSKPESLPPLEDDTTPLPVPPVSLDELFGKEDR